MQSSMHARAPESEREIPGGQQTNAVTASKSECIFPWQQQQQFDAAARGHRAKVCRFHPACLFGRRLLFKLDPTVIACQLASPICRGTCSTSVRIPGVWIDIRPRKNLRALPCTGGPSLYLRTHASTYGDFSGYAFLPLPLQLFPSPLSGSVHPGSKT